MITQAQFETYIRNATGNSTYTLTSSQLGLFSYFIALYQEQLQESGILDVTKTIQSREYDIAYCQLEYLATPIWQEAGLVVEKLTRGSNTSLVLNKNEHYTYKTFQIGLDKYIQAIDFKCLSCNCECEIIRITGYYGIKIPQYILNLIMNIIYNNLATGTVTTIGGSDCCSNIKSKSDGSGFSVTYYDKPVTTLATTKDKDNLLSYPIISNWLNKYYKYFIVI